jgi:flagellar motor switch protein FliM
VTRSESPEGGGDAQALVKLALASDRARRACERLSNEGRALEGAVRRSLPHLVRRKIPVSAEPPRTVIEAEVFASAARPFHVTPIRLGVDRRALGALVLDANAIAHGLDGMLGSGRGDVPRLDEGGLSAAQAALAARLARGLVAAFDEVFGRLGAPFEIASGAAGGQPASVLVSCTVAVGADTKGRIVILVPATLIDGGEQRGDDESKEAEPATRSAVADVEVELVAELGCVTVSLARLASLRVGEVMTLPLSVEAPVSLRVGDRRLFEGKPTTRGSQIVLELSERPSSPQRAA